MMIPSTTYIKRMSVTSELIDFQGHVSNVAILHLMNEATIEHAESLGWDEDAFRRVGGMFVVRRNEIDYRHPAFCGDEIEVRTWAVSMVKARAVRRHEIVRVADGATIAEGLNYWTYIDIAKKRPCWIHLEVIQAFLPNREEVGSN